MSENPPPEPDVSITVYPGGPLIVRGAFTLQNADLEPIDPRRQVVALCRCGLSRRKPLCDGTHALSPPEANRT
ncbi:CDGSH iron-sulfur domain-containing protein [Kineosporia sp. NBRC 101731]|uniref:CDGSH iron-sulfur domain-containing protein n=1 Tax=Kineosporia sp. NBRC 101731 TaxID=3032199 RepID=UPI0024A50A0C|nr:hypothetical protein Kisp02_68160 [Kineosporia sp. NBRC 101731]